MLRLLLLFLVVVAGFLSKIPAQDLGAWRLAYGDTTAPVFYLPVLLNPLPVQGNFRLESVKRWNVRGNRMTLDSYDVCFWKKPGEVEVQFATNWDIIGYYPIAQYLFDASGQVAEYTRYGQKIGNPWELEIYQHGWNQYNQSDHEVFCEWKQNLTQTEYCNYSSHLSRSLGGKTKCEVRRKNCNTPGAPTDMDSVVYFYDSVGQVTESVRYTGPSGTLPERSERILHFYDTLNRLTETRSEDWIPSRPGWCTREQVRYTYDDQSRVAGKLATTFQEGGYLSCRRLLYTYSPDGLGTSQSGAILKDTVWVENYYYQEVINSRGQPVIIDEFHRNEQGNYYVNKLDNSSGRYRTNGDLRGKNRFEYDENGLLISFSNYSKMDQDEKFPDILMIFKWKQITTAVNVTTEQQGIRIFPNPCTDRIFIDLNRPTRTAFNVEVLDLKGQLFSRFTRYSTGKVVEIQVSNLSPGIYLLRMIGDDEVITSKFIRE